MSNLKKSIDLGALLKFLSKLTDETLEGPPAGLHNLDKFTKENVEIMKGSGLTLLGIVASFVAEQIDYNPSEIMRAIGLPEELIKIHERIDNAAAAVVAEAHAPLPPRPH